MFLGFQSILDVRKGLMDYYHFWKELYSLMSIVIKNLTKRHDGVSFLMSWYLQKCAKLQLDGRVEAFSPRNHATPNRVLVTG